MKVLVVGAGGVGAAFAAIAQRRPVFSQVVMADISLERARAAAERLGEPDRFGAERVDASDQADVAALIARVAPDAVLNATDPRFNEQIFEAAFESRVTYLDMAMTLSHPHPENPYELPGEMLGEMQLAQHERWQQAGLLALVGIGVEPGPVRPVRPPRRRRAVREHRRSGSPRRRRPARRGLRLRAHVLDLDHDRGVPEPAADLGARARLLHHRARSPSPRCSSSPRASGRSNA